MSHLSQSFSSIEFCRTTTRSYPSNTFSSNYNFYDSNKHSGDYLYPVSADVLGNWKHYNLSADTLNYRNNRAKSPLVTRQLNRYQLFLVFYSYFLIVFLDTMRSNATMLETLELTFAITTIAEYLILEAQMGTSKYLI